MSVCALVLKQLFFSQLRPSDYRSSRAVTQCQSMWTHCQWRQTTACVTCRGTLFRFTAARFARFVFLGMPLFASQLPFCSRRYLVSCRLSTLETQVKSYAAVVRELEQSRAALQQWQRGFAIQHQQLQELRRVEKEHAQQMKELEVTTKQEMQEWIQ